jgi:hypothetical protein
MQATALPTVLALLALAAPLTAQPRHGAEQRPRTDSRPAAPALTEEEFAAVPFAPAVDWHALADTLPKLEFDVDVSLFGRQATLEVGLTRADDTVQLTSHARTRGLLRLFYKVELDGASAIDAATGRVRDHTYRGTLGRRPIEGSRTYDYTAGRIVSEETQPAARTRDFALEDDCHRDLLTALLHVTRLPAEPGQRWRLPVFHDDRVHTLLLVAEGVEPLERGGATVQALRITAWMPVRPSSFFRRGGRMTLWVTVDEPRLPVKLRLETSRTTATAELRDP